MNSPAGFASPRHFQARTPRRGLFKRALLLALPATLSVLPAALAAEPKMPIFDAHVHYSHDAWDRTPTKEAIATLRDVVRHYSELDE